LQALELGLHRSQVEREHLPEVALAEGADRRQVDADLPQGADELQPDQVALAVHAVAGRGAVLLGKDADLDQAEKIIAGTARSMGLEIKE
jgi:hypothetical protein